jgi:hypothetical protein
MEIKKGDKVKVLNDVAFEQVKRGLDPYTLKTVEVAEVITDEQGTAQAIKFVSGSTRHEDGTEEPYYLTYTLERIHSQVEADG